VNALVNNTTGSNNSAVGYQALFSNETGGSNVAVGYEAGLYHANGTTELKNPESSIYIGANARGCNNDDDNTIVIGAGAVGTGANQTVINNTSTTQTKIDGTTSSTLIVSGQNLRLVTQRTIATIGTTGIKGDICHDSSYIYVCVAANQWRRVALSAW